MAANLEDLLDPEALALLLAVGFMLRQASALPPPSPDTVDALVAQGCFTLHGDRLGLTATGFLSLACSLEAAALALGWEADA